MCIVKVMRKVCLSLSLVNFGNEVLFQQVTASVGALHCTTHALDSFSHISSRGCRVGGGGVCGGALGCLSFVACMWQRTFHQVC